MLGALNSFRASAKASGKELPPLPRETPAARAASEPVRSDEVGHLRARRSTRSEMRHHVLGALRMPVPASELTAEMRHVLCLQARPPLDEASSAALKHVIGAQGDLGAEAHLRGPLGLHGTLRPLKRRPSQVRRLLWAQVPRSSPPTKRRAPRAGSSTRSQVRAAAAAEHAQAVAPTLVSFASLADTCCARPQT